MGLYQNKTLNFPQQLTNKKEYKTVKHLIYKKYQLIHQKLKKIGVKEKLIHAIQSLLKSRLLSQIYGKE
jgi:ribosomal 50S subunit-associated protein YjgA (DUF615 family)